MLGTFGKRKKTYRTRAAPSHRESDHFGGIARLQPGRMQNRGALTIYRLRDVQQPIILVACSKCDWRAAFSRDELIVAHGADQPLPDLLDHLAAPGCPRLRSGWDCCGVHYVERIEAG
jgi:hypothetical protein